MVRHRSPQKPFGPVLARLTLLFTIPVTIGISTLFWALSRAPHSSGPIAVDRSAPKWNSSLDPLVITHLSDLHISTIRQTTSVPRTRQSLDFIGHSLNSTFTVLTGDLTDNLEGLSVWSPSHPIADHWRLYAEIVRRCAIPPSKIVEVLGNHDCWGSLSFKPFASAALLHPPHASWHSRSVEGDGVRIVTFVPQRFPIGRALYDFVIPIRREFLDALEAELDRPTRARFTVVASHFPTSMMFPLEWAKSTKTKRSLLEILGDQKYRIAAYVNGHTHPPGEFDTFHHPGFVEITAGALLDRDGVQVLSVDNGRLGYVRMRPDTAELAIVTSPGSDRVASRVFGDREFEIRVVSFAKGLTNFTVRGDVEGTLVWQRNLSSGATLWAMSAAVENGRHSIRIVGDLNRVVNFTVGVAIEPFEEVVAVDLKGMPFFVGAVALVAVSMIAFASFVWLPGFARALLERVWRYLNGEIVWLGGSRYFLWALAPFFTGWVIRKLPMVIRFYAVFLLWSSFLLPFGITRLDSSLCFQTTFGFVAGGKFVFDVAGQVLGFFYIVGVVFGSLALVARFAFREPDRTHIDVSAVLVLFFAVIYQWEQIGRDTTVNGTILRISIGFHVIPLVSIGFYMRFKRINKSKEE